jgi:hypothetical protein
VSAFHVTYRALGLGLGVIMTLVLELRDAVTGTLLARGFDRATGTDTGRFQWSNSVMNRAEAERALSGWAKRLQDALNAAKSP